MPHLVLLSDESYSIDFCLMHFVYDFKVSPPKFEEMYKLPADTYSNNMIEYSDPGKQYT